MKKENNTTGITLLGIFGLVLCGALTWTIISDIPLLGKVPLSAMLALSLFFVAAKIDQLLILGTFKTTPDYKKTFTVLWYIGLTFITLLSATNYIIDPIEFNYFGEIFGCCVFFWCVVLVVNVVKRIKK